MLPQENNQNPLWTPTKKFFSDTILVALLTGVGYLAAFAYQYSYLTYFNIPILYIDINLRLILFTTFVGLTLFISIGTAIFFLIDWKPKKKFSKICKSASLFIIFLCGLLFPMLADMYANNAWLFFAILLLIIIGLIVVVIGLYRNPELPDKTEIKKNRNGLLDKANQLYGSFPVLFVIIVFFFYAHSFGLGKVAAQNKTEYLVSNTNPRLIIISTYSDSFIGLSFDNNTLKFNKEIFLLSKDKVSEDNISFTLEKIGRLTSN